MNNVRVVEENGDYLSAKVYVDNELWGKICLDEYFNMWRHSDDRYVTLFTSRKAVVAGLVESVIANFKRR